MVKFLLTAFFCIFVTLPAYATDKESVYERVMRTGTIKCGYGLWSIYLDKNPNTGEMSGIFYDYMETLGDRLSLKIEWTEEIGWGDFIAALENNRFDAYCTIVGYNAERAREIDYLSPLFYLGADAFVKAGDTRFDNNIQGANAPDVTMATIEGDLYSKISVRDYPLSQKYEMPQLATQAELFLSVANGKADITITETSAGEEFMESNPGKIR